MIAVSIPTPSPEGGATRWSVERKLTLGYALMATMVGLMVALCYWQAVRYVEFNRWVEHTHEVIDTIETVRQLVTDAETNQRAFWLLGEDQQRMEAEAAMNALPGHLRNLGELIADNSGQEGRLRELGRVVREKLARVRLNLEVRGRQDLASMMASGYVSGAGQRLGQRVRAVTGEMIAAEQALLRERLVRRHVILRGAFACLAALSGLIGLLLAGIYKLGDSELRARRQLSRDLEAARDAALEAARQKSEFLANMSHEIRTPLNGIVGMAGLLRDCPLDGEGRECAATIDTCAAALLAVINDVLDFSKMEAGRMAMTHEAFDLRETLDETLTILAARATAKGLELNAFISHDVPAGLVGDAVRLRQVLLNLLGNAVKFTERGEVALHVSHARHQRAGGAAEGPARLRFEVRDTGIGIAPEGRGRLFQAFTQVDGSNTRRHGGTGLGLAISKELVARMGGEIGVESVSGVGSKFWFTARFDPDPALAGVPGNSLPPAAATLLTGWRVLLAGEASADRRLVQGMLTNWGLFHQNADDGHRALAMLRLAAASGRPFHAALLDADLSGLSGLALAAGIRADAELGGTRLVYLSDPPGAGEGNPPEDFDARLPRPVRSRALLEALRRMAAGEQPPARATPMPPPRLAVPPVAVAPGSGPRILLAEDNPINRKVALRQLQNLGCVATAAENGRELLTRLEKGESFDLILMDVQMPEMDGYETTRHLRTHFWSVGAGPPIVAMTANAMEGDRDKCLAAGMDDYLAKPVKQDGLEAVLRRWLPLRGDAWEGRPRDRHTVSVG